MRKPFKLPYDGMLLIILLVLCGIMAALSPFFLTVDNLVNLFNQTATYLFLAIGMTFVICSGSIDLSVGTIIGFTGMVISELYNLGLSPGLAVLAGLASAVLIGLVNGWITAYLRINSFIATLCTMTIFRGVVLLITNSESLFGFGKFISFFGTGEILHISVPILMAAVCVVLGWLLLHHTRFGTYTLFLGANQTALQRFGVNEKRAKMLVFILSGLLAGIAGLVIVARLDSAQPLAGSGYEMDAIAAVILGGTALEGGRGSVLGAVLGCLILNVISNGLTLLSVSTHYQSIITGVVLIFAVLISEKNRRDRLSGR